MEKIQSCLRAFIVFSFSWLLFVCDLLCDQFFFITSLYQATSYTFEVVDSSELFTAKTGHSFKLQYLSSDVTSLS